MVKMMLTLLSLAATVPLATAGTLTCALDGAGALDSTTNAAVYFWASSQRCAAGSAHSDTKCAVDVVSAIKSVNDMVDIIVAAANTCGDVKTKHTACGLAVGSLTSAMAGLAANSINLAHWIKHKDTVGDAVRDSTTTKVGKCVVNVKGVASSIFQGAAAIKAATKGCGEGETCAADALQVLAVLSSMGRAIAHSVSDCSKNGNSNAAFSGDIVGLFGALNGVGQAGIAVDENCKVSDARLYLESDNAKKDKKDHAMSFVMVAFLPVAAVLGFVGGRRANKARPTRDLGSMEIAPLVVE